MKGCKFRLAASAALIAGSPVSASPDRWIPLAQAGKTIDGVWRSRGYGHILQVRDGKRITYHVAGDFCYPDPSTTDTDDESYRLVSVASRSQIVFAAAPDQTRYVFDRIATLPPGCAVSRRWTAHDMADLIAATFIDLYPGFGQRGWTRDKFTAALAVSGDTRPDLAFFQHVARALDGLNDAHVGLAATIDGIDHDAESGEAATIRHARANVALGTDLAERERNWSRAYRESITGVLTGGGHQVANRRILWGRIGRIGYLNVVSMGAFDKDAPSDDLVALDGALDEALADFQGLPGVIVDVTNNRGGYDAISLHIAGRFADRRRLAFTKRAVGARGDFQRFYVEPSDRRRYLGKVVLLTSDVTVSAGETFTLAMRALPNVTQIGGKTRGALSDQLVKPLPNGWTLTLPAEVYRDPAGRSQEGVGISPDQVVLPFAPDHGVMVQRIAAGMAPLS
jgi:carboxyl-terminal processing protease